MPVTFRSNKGNDGPFGAADRTPTPRSARPPWRHSPRRRRFKRGYRCPSATAAARLSANTSQQAGRKGRRHRQDKHRALRWAEKAMNQPRAAQRRRPGPASLAKTWECPSPNRSAWRETSIWVRSALEFLLERLSHRTGAGRDAFRRGGASPRRRSRISRTRGSRAAAIIAWPSCVRWIKSKVR